MESLKDANRRIRKQIILHASDSVIAVVFQWILSHQIKKIIPDIKPAFGLKIFALARYKAMVANREITH
jgi:hypothetical protein